MRGWTRLLVGLTILSGGSTAGATDLEPALSRGYTATYEAQALGSTLTVTKTLSWNGTTGEMHLSGKVRGFLRLFGRFEMDRGSSFRIEDGDLRLLGSRAWQVSPSRERSHDLRLDEDTGVFVGQVNDQPVRIEAPGDVLDFLTTLYWSRIQLARERQDLEGIPVTILERDRLRTYHLHVSGSDRILTPLGELDTLQVLREDRERDTALSAWFAPDLGFMPVRIDYDADGRILSLNLTRIEWH